MNECEVPESLRPEWSRLEQIEALERACIKHFQGGIPWAEACRQTIDEAKSRRVPRGGW